MAIGGFGTRTRCWDGPLLRWRYELSPSSGCSTEKPVPVLDQHFGSVLVAVETAVEQNIEGEALGGYVLVNFLCERDRAFLALRERDGFGQASGTDRQHGGAAAGIRIGFGRHRDGGRAGSSALGRYAAPLPGVAEAISALHVVLVVKVTDSDPPPVASVFSVPPESVSSGAGPSSCLSHPASHAAVKAKKSRSARFIKIVGLIRDCCVLLA